MRLLLKLTILSQYNSQGEFAQLIGRSESWLSRVLKGKQNPSLEEKRLILSKLENNPGDYLFLNR
jgi:transcriptional regulator with XRE-family HTH domain